ncbi:putative methyltransferase [Gottschalkia purinilytica]|uniref:Putative methyltransferase n=1 Tax=Gottschalkia purinilytica TaxID=1503 RepID=A0A0L0W7Q6_GOTPU|nr:class I SAM-dependent methyltransferase [Gottschalkia purinilytica]KNF07466.1 putative methyltransferase [Gottschalkia purinilytica]
MKTYKDFAFLYDRLMEDVDYKMWFEYIKSIFKKYNKKPDKILEMACGTGNLTKYLCEEIRDVTCFDLSDEMLTVAYDKLQYYNNVDILKQNMIDFNLNKKEFESIICCCDSINYITDESELYKVFENTYKHLTKNGLFIFDINSYYKLKYIIGENTFIEDTDEVFYTWENEFIEEESLCYFYLTFFMKENEKYIRFDETHIEKAYTENQLKNMLKKVGFSKVDTYDAFNFYNVSEKSERIFFIASKNS